MRTLAAPKRDPVPQLPLPQERRIESSSASLTDGTSAPRELGGRLQKGALLEDHNDEWVSGPRRGSRLDRAQSERSRDRRAAGAAISVYMPRAVLRVEKRVAARPRDVA